MIVFGVGVFLPGGFKNIEAAEGVYPIPNIYLYIDDTGDGNYQKITSTSTLSLTEGNYNFKVRLSNIGEASWDNKWACGVHVEIFNKNDKSPMGFNLINYDFTTSGVDNPYYFDKFANQVLPSSEVYGFELIDNYLRTSSERYGCFSVYIHDDTTIRFRGWIMDKDDMVTNPNNLDQEHYITRNPSDVNYNKHIDNPYFSNLHYSAHSVNILVGEPTCSVNIFFINPGVSQDVDLFVDGYWEDDMKALEDSTGQFNEIIVEVGTHNFKIEGKKYGEISKQIKCSSNDQIISMGSFNEPKTTVKLYFNNNGPAQNVKLYVDENKNPQKDINAPAYGEACFTGIQVERYKRHTFTIKGDSFGEASKEKSCDDSVETFTLSDLTFIPLDVTIKGIFEYYPCAGYSGIEYLPVRYARVKLCYDDDYGNRHEIDNDCLNENGEFNFGPFDFNTIANKPNNLYVVIIAEADAVVVYYNYINRGIYEYRYDLEEVTPGENNIGNIQIVLKDAYPWGIYNTIIDGYQFISCYDVSPPKVDVHWEESIGLSVYVKLVNYMQIKYSDCFYPSVILHEYAHFLIDKYMGWDLYCTGLGNHEWGSPSQDDLAFEEGFAHFFQAAVKTWKNTIKPNFYARPNYLYALIEYNYNYNLENMGTDPISSIEYSKYENCIAGILWDIFDDVDDDYNADGIGDQLDGGFEPIWQVVKDYDPQEGPLHNHPQTINEFWDGWFEIIDPDRESEEELWAIYYEHGIDKPISHSILTVDTGGSYICVAGFPVQFFGDASGGTGQYTYEWDFNFDGTFSVDSHEKNPRFVYNIGNNYSIALRVSDGKSTEIEFTYVRVADKSLDINDDGQINVVEMIGIGQHWGQKNIPNPGWIPEDINRDGIVNVLDMIRIGQYWIG